jgi:hypothetical protein
VSAFLYFCFWCRVWVWNGHGSGVHGPRDQQTREHKILLARRK